jgi:predicted enzyme related to lactoylglutathione lyase
MNGGDGQVLGYIVLVMLFMVAPIIVGARLAERRGRSVWYGILFGLLGWLGVIAVLVLTASRAGAVNGAPKRVPERMRPCPTCEAPLAATSGRCPSCNADSPAWTLHGGHWWSRDDTGEWRYLDDARAAWVSPADGSAVPAPAEAALTPVATAAAIPTAAPAAASVGASSTSGILGIDHVQVAAPPGREFDARRFYGGLIGLEEIDKPSALVPRGGCWFRAGRQELHVGVTEDFAAATKAHPALRLRSERELTELAERLQEAGYEVRWADDAEIPGSRRFHVDDPFGNRIELLSVASPNA